jgi:hypothetical protein
MNQGFDQRGRQIMAFSRLGDNVIVTGGVCRWHRAFRRYSHIDFVVVRGWGVGKMHHTAAVHIQVDVSRGAGHDEKRQPDKKKGPSHCHLFDSFTLFPWLPETQLTILNINIIIKQGP